MEQALDRGSRNSRTFEERAQWRFAVKDKFESHGLPAETLAALLAQLRAIPDLRAIYLVKKRVLFFPHRPLDGTSAIRSPAPLSKWHETRNRGIGAN